LRGALHRNAEGIGELLLDCLGSALDAQMTSAAEEGRRVEQAEHQQSVGQRRCVAAEAVARRPRRSAHAFRAQ
jgi:hypothetical protein